MHGGRTSGNGGRFSVASAQSIKSSTDLYGCALQIGPVPPGNVTPAGTVAAGSSTHAATAAGNLASTGAADTSANQQAHGESGYKLFERKLSAELVWKLRAELELKTVRFEAAH